MQDSSTDRGGQLRSFNAVFLQNAVLCVDCDCVTDSPHERCLVCGSRSLFNLSRVLGGTLARSRGTVTELQTAEPPTSVAKLVLNFPKRHEIHSDVAV